MLPSDYIERVYAGVLGKTIGVRHGSNDEGWSYEKIRETFGEVTDYLFTFRNFAADDDTNGTFLLPLALRDYGLDRESLSDHVADTLLNYAPDHHGFFWWGPYGVSTERTAYDNLKAGLRPPYSGSAACNGPTIAEQIGGQIFIDGWGMLAPGEEALAADLAARAACVTHGDNGVYGGMFIAAAVAAAFDAKDIGEVLRRALAVIPEDCTYARMVRDIRRFFDENPDDWRACLAYIRKNYWQDKYPGNCHIMPNAAMMMLSMLYGRGSFSDTINICNMCGWDTDCNVANVGAILGVLVGLKGIDWKWREPIGDFLAFSCALGDQNISNLGQVTYELAALGYALHGEEVPPQLRRMTARDARRFDFSLPGCIQSFRAEAEGGDAVRIFQVAQPRRTGGGALRLLAATAEPGAPVRLFLLTYYHPSDFNDSRYDPSFSPVAYPGQRLRACVRAPRPLRARLFFEDDRTGEIQRGERVCLAPGVWTELTLRIPAGTDARIRRVGLEAEGAETGVDLLLDEFAIEGGADYAVNFAREGVERWNPLHEEISQCMFNCGSWTLEEGRLAGRGAPLAEIFTGSTTFGDGCAQAVLVPRSGPAHNLEFCVQGAARCYAAGLAQGGKVRLYKKHRDYAVLTEADFPWELGRAYAVAAEHAGGDIRVLVDGREVLRFRDEENPYLRGSVGVSIFGAGRCDVESICVKEAESHA